MKKQLFLGLVIVMFSFSLLKSQTYNYYYGNIHSQTSYSDGNKDSATSLITKPLQAFNYAKSSQHIDFYGVSDHNHLSAGMTSPVHYHSGIADAIAATNSTFVAMYGFEWGVISGGGHVIVYGCDSLMGWDAGDYDIFVAQSNYTTLWSKIIARPNSFAYLAHPQTGDYGNILSTAVNINADSAIIGMAGRSGPAFSTNTSYSDPSTSDYISKYQEALSQGYHVGVGLDHDTHNSVFGRQTAGRLVVLAPTLTKANIYNAFKKMRFYCSDDWNVKVNFQIQNQPMGSIITHSGTPTLSVSITDSDVAESVSTISVYYGVPGSALLPTILTSVTNTPNLTFTHAAATNLSKYYYYIEITQADGDKIWTSPIWYNRNDAVVGSIPVAANTTPTNVICAGQSITYTDASSNSPTSWAWTASGGSPSSSTLQNPTFTYTTAGTYSITLVATNASGSSAPVTKTISVKASPNVTTTSAIICAGTSTNLIASGATTYLWNTSATTNSINVSPISTTNYTVTATSLGCSKTVTTSVTVNPTPTLSLNSATICSGNSANLTVSGATNYLWNTSATTNSINVSPSSTTNYTVTGTSLGCSKTVTTSVTVNPTPTLSLNSATICSGNSANLTVSGATNYLWNTGSTATFINVNPASTTNYTVTGTSLGCSKTNTTTVIVNALPILSVISATICAGATATITVSGANTYTWNTGATTNVIVASPATTTNYTVNGTSAAGCYGASASATITVGTAPSIVVNSASVCAGNSATLTASGVTTFTWSTGSNSNNIIVTPTVNTTYNVSGNLAGCSIGASNTASVIVNALPNVVAVTSNSVICAGQSTTLTASGAVTYSWNTTATTAVIIVAPTTATTYTVIGTNGNGCKKTTTVLQNVNVCTGLNNITNISNSNFFVYPNPTNGKITIETEKDNAFIQIEVINELGQQLYTTTNKDCITNYCSLNIDLSNYLNGIYFIKISTSNETKYKKIILQK